MENTGTQTFFSAEEVRKNKIKSGILIGVLMALVFGLSYWLGYLWGDPKAGLITGAVLSLIVVPVQILTAKWMILGMAHGKKADPDDPKQRRALQLTEGLSIAAGFSRTPPLYIIPSRVPNAFASGMSEKDAFIGVTQGLLDIMDEQELEGVIGHEVSHIIHRDIMLNQLVVGFVSVLLILAVLIERTVWYGGGRRGSNRSSGSDKGGAGILILVLIVVSILVRPIAYLIGNLIQLAISRNREYMADAHSVRLCSYNGGLSRALEKIGKFSTLTPEDVEALGGRQLACMYINFPGGELFSTHPPIAERVRRINAMY